MSLERRVLVAYRPVRETVANRPFSRRRWRTARCQELVRQRWRTARCNQAEVAHRPLLESEGTGGVPPSGRNGGEPPIFAGKEAMVANRPLRGDDRATVANRPLRRDAHPTVANRPLVPSAMFVTSGQMVRRVFQRRKNTAVKNLAERFWRSGLSHPSDGSYLRRYESDSKT